VNICACGSGSDEVLGLGEVDFLNMSSCGRRVRGLLGLGDINNCADGRSGISSGSKSGDASGINDCPLG
jgi:hypothetical protein